MLNIAILGYGLIGSGVADILTGNRELIAKKTGEAVNIKYILDIKKIDMPPLNAVQTDKIDTITSDKTIKLAVEAMGGSHPAYEFTKACLMSGISVVTSNKEVVANFGAELLATAKKNGVKYFFEASVGGGIPLIRPIANGLAANNISAITAILNGTTNFILTKMERENMSFSDALTAAQANGYAERDPSADINGTDTCRKICILCSLAFGRELPPAKVHTEGIAGVTLADIRNAQEAGHRVKLIAKANLTEENGGGLRVIVAPMLVPEDSPLYSVSDVFNGIVVTGDSTGDVMFYGRGAGKLPTASAAAADIIDILTNQSDNIIWEPSDGAYVTSHHIGSARYYLRLANANGEKYVITDSISERELDTLKKSYESEGNSVKSEIRLL
ncbi:hypothetical protein FACS1894219_04120 [Clostridia bacterium]|nr:hypothetical protein FACS1894219_04120 [Clostridia bacterium]